MEDGLVPFTLMATDPTDAQSLNPCCSGRWSRTRQFINLITVQSCLNPCCSGRWSRTGETILLTGEVGLVS